MPVMSVENPAGGLHYLTVTGAPEFLGTTAAVRMLYQLFDVCEYKFDKLRRCDRIL